MIKRLAKLSKALGSLSLPAEERLVLSLMKAAIYDANVENIQNLLVSRGFPLPIHGVDGIYGPETRGAIMDFEESVGKTPSGIIDDDLEFRLNSLSIEGAGLAETAAANLYSDGESSGPDATPPEVPADFGIITDALSTSLQTLSVGHAYIESDDESATQPGGILYLGDSQMAGALGRALGSKFGPGVNLSKAGTKASYWAGNEELAAELAKGPSKIIISLNGNGISGTNKLIKFIKDNTPNDPAVTWSGAPPAVKRAGGMKNKYTDVTTDSGLSLLQAKRRGWNDSVRKKVEAAGWTFIDPYDFLKRDDGSAGYDGSGGDGLHLTQHAADLLARFV